MAARQTTWLNTTDFKRAKSVKKSRTDSYSSPPALERSLTQIKAMLLDAGARKIYAKALAHNDNSKNQIYLGGNFSSLNIIPTLGFEIFESSSGKGRLRQGEKLIQAKINFTWIDPYGEKHPAPGTKLILYPQYPEIRLSGYLQGSSINASEWMDPTKQGRSSGRYLLIGVCPDGACLGYLATPTSPASNELRGSLRNDTQLLTEIPITNDSRVSHRTKLLEELKKVHLASPIFSQKLDAHGIKAPYKAANGAGYTLEAELGISPNGYATPDYDGWEIKAHSESPVTLMTPEPNGGLYQREGVDTFVRRYGYADKRGRADRLNFGGIHRINEPQRLTGLTMHITGYINNSNTAKADGGIVLVDADDNIAAEWTFTKLLEHWNRKHAKAAYVPYTSKNTDESILYSYGDHVHLGEGTDFIRLLRAFSSGKAFYDPGIKLVGMSQENPNIKRRNQFRMKFESLSILYEKWEKVDLC